MRVDRPHKLGDDPLNAGPVDGVDVDVDGSAAPGRRNRLAAVDGRQHRRAYWPRHHATAEEAQPSPKPANLIEESHTAGSACEDVNHRLRICPCLPLVQHRDNLVPVPISPRLRTERHAERHAIARTEDVCHGVDSSPRERIERVTAATSIVLATTATATSTSTSTSTSSWGSFTGRHDENSQESRTRQ